MDKSERWAAQMISGLGIGVSIPVIAFENVTHHNYIGCQRVGHMLTHVNVKFADNIANVRKHFAIKQNRIETQRSNC